MSKFLLTLAAVATISSAALANTPATTGDASQEGAQPVSGEEQKEKEAN